MPHESPFVESGTVPQIDAETPLYLAKFTMQIFGHVPGTVGTKLFAHTFLLYAQGTAAPKRLYPLHGESPYIAGWESPYTHDESRTVDKYIL